MHLVGAQHLVGVPRIVEERDLEVETFVGHETAMHGDPERNVEYGAGDGRELDGVGSLRRRRHGGEAEHGGDHDVSTKLREPHGLTPPICTATSAM